MTTPVQLLRRESGSLVQRLRLWTPSRYAALADEAAGLPAGSTRADVVRHLAQVLADTAAVLEGGPLRALPRLAGDLPVADQLAVTSDDLVRCDPPAEVAVAATAHLLAHRADLLGDAVPSGLAESLGLGDVEAAGRQACRAGQRDGRPPRRGPAVAERRPAAPRSD